MNQRLSEKVAEFQSAAQPAHPGPETAEIRQVQRTVPDADKYQDINVPELPAQRVRELAGHREAAHQEMMNYEAGPAPIQGVWLDVGDRGL